MTITIKNHSLHLVDHIPPSDLVSDECCMLTLTPYEELNKNRKIVQIACNNINRYFDVEAVLLWIASSKSKLPLCLQCKAPLDIKELRELRIVKLNNDLLELEAAKKNYLPLARKLENYIQIQKLFEIPQKNIELEFDSLEIETLTEKVDELSKKQQTHLSYLDAWKLSEDLHATSFELEKLKLCFKIKNEDLQVKIETIKRMEKFKELTNSDLLYENKFIFLSMGIAVVSFPFSMVVTTASLFLSSYTIITNDGKLDELSDRLNLGLS